MNNKRVAVMSRSLTHEVGNVVVRNTVVSVNNNDVLEVKGTQVVTRTKEDGIYTVNPITHEVERKVLASYPEEISVEQHNKEITNKMMSAIHRNAQSERARIKTLYTQAPKQSLLQRILGGIR